MGVGTVVLFFLYTWGLGFVISSYVKSTSNSIERNVMRIGIGLGSLPILLVILNLFNVPLDWKILLGLIAASLILILGKDFLKLGKLQIPKFDFKLSKDNLYGLIAIFLGLILLGIFLKGAFSYPYLENDDSWSHALGVKYVALEKRIYVLGDKPFFQYLDPYPPGYDGILGILHQTSASLSWTLKFFNSLIISLGIIFFYFFARHFMRNRNKALLATFILMALPSHLSHFIWALALSVPLFYVLMYCLLAIKHDRKWIIPSSIVYSGLLLSQPSSAIKMSVMLLIFVIVNFIFERKESFKVIVASVIGGLLSFLWWGLMFVRWGNPLSGAEWYGITGGDAYAISSSASKWFLRAGTADRIYSFKDFFIASKNNMINNPIGLGAIVTIFLIIAVVLLVINFRKIMNKKKQYLLVSLLWLLFAFIGIHGARLPVQFIAFRFWLLFALPVSILTAEGIMYTASLIRKFGIKKIITIGVILIGIVLTSLYPKYVINTSTWSPGGSWNSQEELAAYLSLKSLPVDTKVYPLSGAGHYAHIVGLDKMVCSWCALESQLAREGRLLPVQELHTLLRNNGFEYLIIDTLYARTFGINETNQKISELGASNGFTQTFANNGAVIFKVN